MNRFLEKFKEIPRGVRLGTVYTVEWATAVQDAIRALAQGENLTLERGLVRGVGDGKVSLGLRRERKIWVTKVILPFQITATAAKLRAEPGVLDGVPMEATEVSSPADGVWYCQAKIVINATTGDVSSRTVGWSQTWQENTTTDFYGDIGEIEYIAGAPDMELFIQYNYGPLLKTLYGAVSEKWALVIY